MLGFSTAAWTLAPRDTFVGWTPQLREKNLPLVVDNPEVPDPALDQYPQSRLAHPRHRPPPPAPGLDRALQHHARADRDLRPDAALHRCRLQGLRLDPCRNHQGTRALRPGQAVRQAKEGRLAAPPPTGLEANPQSVKSPGRRTLTRIEPLTPGKRSVGPGWRRRNSGSPVSRANGACPIPWLRHRPRQQDGPIFPVPGSIVALTITPLSSRQS